MKQLYPYQLEVVRELTEHYKGRRHARHYLHMATGSGKTLTVMEFLAENYLQKSKRVLWITHRWPLINHAVSQLIEQRPIFNPTRGSLGDAIAFYGSYANRNTASLRESRVRPYRDSLFVEKPQLLFSSWQTLYSSLKDRRAVQFKALKNFEPDLIVIDEAHYGKNGQQESDVYDLLINQYWKNVPMLGLSATPKVRGKHGWSKTTLGNIYFSRLVDEGYLAKPIIIDQSLEADVQIRFNTRNHWIENEREIATDRTRNNGIVQYYCANKRKLGKTIMFAINTEHADNLANHLTRRGIAAVAIHSKTQLDPNELITSFRNGEYDVAIAVDMMNEGIDVPDIKTVFLSRPVTSEILFAQMIGRGCRKLPGKETFNVVDFHNLNDNEENRKHLLDYKKWYNSEEAERFGSAKRSPSTMAVRENGHVSDFEPAMRTLSYDAATDPIHHLILNGLRIDESQTFGLEFEFEAEGINIEDKRAWLSVARPVLNHFRSIFGEASTASHPAYENPKSISHRKWNVVYDGSCGFEIVSPVLRGKQGFETVVRALRSLRASGLIDAHKLKLSTKTGTHVHLGWRYNDPEKVRDILSFMRRFEGAFHSLIAPSRILTAKGAPHPFCRSVRSSFGKSRVSSIQRTSDVRRIFGRIDRRYCALNLTNFDGPQSTLEIRSHHGTLDEGKICLWLALWMNVHNALARIKVADLGNSEAGIKPLLPDHTPDSDIVSLAQSHLDITSESNLAMLAKLHQRRIEVTGNEWWGRKLDNGIEKIHRSWIERLPLRTQTIDLPQLPGDVFAVSELPASIRLSTAKLLIEKNFLQYDHPEILAERFSKGCLFVRMASGKVIGTAGVKGKSETLNRLAEDLRRAGFRSGGTRFRLPELRVAAEASRIVERGWDYSTLPEHLSTGLMGMADWLARQSVREAVPVAFVTPNDSSGLDNYESAGWKIVGQITSPFSSNRLSVLIPL